MMMLHLLIWESVKNELVGVKGKGQMFAFQSFATAWLLLKYLIYSLLVERGFQCETMKQK